MKPYNNEDMSAYVKKVHFKLHESYNNPNRIILKPPYELTETGWGEFEIVIKIYFHDPNERPVILYFLTNKILYIYIYIFKKTNFIFFLIYR